MDYLNLKMFNQVFWEMQSLWYFRLALIGFGKKNTVFRCPTSELVNRIYFQVHFIRTLDLVPCWWRLWKQDERGTVVVGGSDGNTFSSTCHSESSLRWSLASVFWQRASILIPLSNPRGLLLRRRIIGGQILCRDPLKRSKEFKNSIE